MNRGLMWWMLAALLYGTVLAFIPLLRELHFLSAALTALLSAFASGWIAAGQTFRAKPTSGVRLLAAILLVVSAPALPLIISGIFRGCLSGDGLAYWLLIPAPSAILGFALGRYFSFQTRYSRLWTISVLVILGFGLLLWELFNYPQVYFHNHVWGYWPGPVYDDIVELNPAVILFRFITLLWAALFWLMPFVRNRKGVRFPVVLVLAALMLSYLNMGRAGILSSESLLQQVLGNKIETEHSIIYYDRSLPDDDALWIGRLHDFHITELAARLEIDTAELDPVHTYLYRDRWQKKRLTGAGGTVYVPVWQRNGQIHIQRDAVERVLRHELVHVLAREFGMPVVNASPNIALVEGLAVALQSERYTSGTLHQIVAAQDSLPGVQKMNRLMGPAGFYAMSGPLSYALAGSFTEWLLQEYDVELFRKAYATGRIRTAYPVPFGELVDGWHQFLRTVETDTVQAGISDRVFSAPGIAEKTCVFHPDRAGRLYDQAEMLIQRGRKEEAFRLLAEFVNGGDNVPEHILRLWVRLALELEEAEQVLKKFESVPRERDAFSTSLIYLVADAYFLSGEESTALLWLGDAGQNSRLHKLRTDRNLRLPYLKMEYGLFTGPTDALSAELTPWLLRFCIRFDQQQQCDVSEFEQHDDELRRFYPVYETWIMELIKTDRSDEAGKWIGMLENQLNDPVSDRARSKRINELRRIKEFAN